jgi:hypothetical protein
MAIRSLLGEIVLTPGDKRGEIHGNVTRRLHGHASKLRAGFPAEISELLPQESLVNGDILRQKPAECNLAQRRRIGANAICRQAHVQACSASSPEA